MTDTNNETTKPYNILLVMTDQHRSDHVSFLPGSKMATPNLDRIAESVGFANCITVNPICTPARVALLTGKYTRQIGMLSMSGDLSLQHPTYLRALQHRGYWTAGVGKFHWLQGWPWGTPRGEGHDLVALKLRFKEFGLDHVWEAAGKQLSVTNYCDYCAYLEQKGLLEAFRDHVVAEGRNSQDPSKIQFTGDPWPLAEENYVDNVIGRQALRALDLRPVDRPFFLMVSFCGPHKPYDPPRSALERFSLDEDDDFIPGVEPLSDAVKQRLYRLRRAYKGMIATIDDQVGRLLARLENDGLLDSTVILLTCDHGEMLGDHGRMSKMQPWRQSINVPTAIRHPAFLGRRTCTTPVEITDLTATMLDVAGLDPQQALSKRWPSGHDYVPCRSLMPIVSGNADRVRDYAYAECMNLWQAVQFDDWKYVRYGRRRPEDRVREELYDLRCDPDELTNRAADPSCAERLRCGREARELIMDLTPPAQLNWAPFGGCRTGPA